MHVRGERFIESLAFIAHTALIPTNRLFHAVKRHNCKYGYYHPSISQQSYIVIYTGLKIPFSLIPIFTAVLREGKSATRTSVILKTQPDTVA